MKTLRRNDAKSLKDSLAPRSIFKSIITDTDHLMMTGLMVLAIFAAFASV